VKKNLEINSSKKECPKDSCQFPNTCKWNQKCMQKELDLSIAAKKTFSESSGFKKEEKSKQKKT
tara:strand:+ start:828 stop:1019 length:192 start_codon:yes stop_codon:yes gene_type:complete